MMSSGLAGVGGLILPRLAGMIKDVTGKEDMAFYIASGLMICGALLALANQRITKGKRTKEEKSFQAVHEAK